MSDERGTVVLVGTNHVSEASSCDVRSAIRRHDPDTVAIELGETRARRLLGEDTSLLADLRDVYRSAGGLATGLALGLRALYSQVDGPVDGGDMTVGARTAAARGCDVALIDREMDETMGAVADGVRSDGRWHVDSCRSWWAEAVRLLRGRDGRGLARHLASHYAQKAKRWYPQLSFAFRHGPEISPEDLDVEMAKELNEIVEREWPATIQALLHERDDHLAGRLHALREDGQTVVAVLGALHVPGVRARLEDPQTIPEEHIRQPVMRSGDAFEHLV